MSMPSRIMGGSGGSGPLSELAAKKAQMEDDGAGVLMSGSVSQYMSEYVSQCTYKCTSSTSRSVCKSVSASVSALVHQSVIK